MRTSYREFRANTARSRASPIVSESMGGARNPRIAWAAQVVRDHGCCYVRTAAAARRQMTCARETQWVSHSKPLRRPSVHGYAHGVSASRTERGSVRSHPHAPHIAARRRLVSRRLRVGLGPERDAGVADPRLDRL